jgi:hypothetical protein
MYIMNKNSTQLKHSIIFGVITGGVISLYLLTLYFFAALNNTALANISGFLFLIGGYVSVRRYRNELKGGFITYGKAYGTAFLTFLFAGLVWTIYEYILYKYLSPGLLEEKIAEAQEALLKLGWSEERVAAFTTLSNPSPFGNALGYFFNATIWGAIISLLIAAFLKRNENPLLKNE